MAHRLIHLAIYQGGVCAEETPADLTLLWNFGPEAELRTEDETFALRRDDVVSLRPQQRYSLRTGEGPVAAVALDGAQLRACLGGRRLAIRCNSAREVSDNYAILRGLLGQVLQAWAEGGPYLEAELGKLYYELALLLANCFGVDLPGEPGTRAEQFTRYLEDHCREELSLQQISEAFHMTPQYFSRQFKAQTGQNFYRSLTAVRLRRAKQDLAETDTPLLRLALDNGFANLESFYHYFQEDTGQTPQAWRAEHRRAETAAALPVLRELVGSLHLEAPAAAPQEEVFAVDAAVRRSYHPFWREVLHLGDAALLDNSLIAGQLRTLQEELHFRFIRIRADCRAFTAGSAYSFYSEERRLDYLMDNGLSIWLYVDFRQMPVPEQMYAYLDRLLSHFANRYSIQNVQKWRLELVYNTIFTPDKAGAFWACRQRLQAILNKYGCRDPLLCAGLTLGAPEAVESFCAALAGRGETLPAQTFEAEPYLYRQTGQGPVLSRATDSSYLKNQLLTLRQNLPYFRDVVRDIYITSWNDNMRNTSGMNDACYKGANLLKTMIDCFGLVRSVTHNIALDAVYPEKTRRNILFGGNGLLSQHGIPKPSYYAYSFLCHVGEYYLARDEHSILFAGKEGNYQVLCHNCKRLNYKYYLDEQKSDLGELDQYFEDLEPLTLRYRLTGVRNGRYVVKRRMVRPGAGSVRDCLREMGAADGVYVHSHDLEYLRQVSVPQVHLQEKTVAGGVLELELTIPANSFAYLHIIYQY